MEILLFILGFILLICYGVSVVFFIPVFHSVEMTRKYCIFYAIVWFIAFPIGVLIELKRGTQK